MKLRCVVTYMHQNYRLHINLIKLKVIITISIILKRLDKKYMLVWSPLQDATLVNFKLMYVWLLLKSMEKIQENLQMK